MELNFSVNGRKVTVATEPETSLLRVVRDGLGLLGTKEGCSEGECGACTVLVEGKPVDSCIYAAIAVEGRSITTVEGLAATEVGRIVQHAFIEAGGIQCGFCTPGFVVTVTALLEQYSAPDDDEIKDALSGNICRCTGYSQIIDAVRLAMNTKEAS